MFLYLLNWLGSAQLSLYINPVAVSIPSSWNILPFHSTKQKQLFVGRPLLVDERKVKMANHMILLWKFVKWAKARHTEISPFAQKMRVEGDVPTAYIAGGLTRWVDDVLSNGSVNVIVVNTGFGIISCRSRVARARLFGINRLIEGLLPKGLHC